MADDREFSNVYTIPPNYTDSGKLLGGLLETRNTVEACILLLLVGYPELMWMHLPATAKVVVMTVTLLPLGVFALMGIGAARVYLAPPSGLRSRSLLLFLVQLAFNFFWSIIFFQFQNFGFALVWLAVLWALILWMLLSVLQVDCTAGWLQVPYLLWVTFAAYLNWGVWLLNPR